MRITFDTHVFITTSKKKYVGTIQYASQVASVKMEELVKHLYKYGFYRKGTILIEYTQISDKIVE